MSLRRTIAVAILVLAALPTDAAERRVTLEGRILVAERSARGEVIAVRLATMNDHILVDSSGKGLELVPLVYERVKVTGIVRRDENGERVLVVERYDLGG